MAEAADASAVRAGPVLGDDVPGDDGGSRIVRDETLRPDNGDSAPAFAGGVVVDLVVDDDGMGDRGRDEIIIDDANTAADGAAVGDDETVDAGRPAGTSGDVNDRADLGGRRRGAARSLEDGHIDRPISLVTVRLGPGEPAVKGDIDRRGVRDLVALGGGVDGGVEPNLYPRDTLRVSVFMP